ncbi:HAD family phosphatase [Streptomyces sp. NPDC051940]|uniref:HAD family hydrolase n=1 Tax=Streptomyces sp. NPDC051940 TaxID=3155675 RepID=UPI003421778D
MNASPAAVFDLDGTLVDSEPNYYAAGREVLRRYGVPDFSWEEHARFIGIGTRETLQVLRERYGIEAPVDELLAAKNEAYLRLAAHGTEAFPRMRKLVEMLHAAGVPMAVASGSSRPAIEAVLPAAGLDGVFDVLVSAEEVPHGKPAPDVFLAAARLLGVEPARCVALEDAPPGVEAARRAGMRTVGVPSLPEHARDPAMVSAGLLFPGGQRTFDAQRAYDWIMGAATPDGRLGAQK